MRTAMESAFNGVLLDANDNNNWQTTYPPPSPSLHVDLLPLHTHKNTNTHTHTVEIYTTILKEKEQRARN